MTDLTLADAAAQRLKETTLRVMNRKLTPQEILASAFVQNVVTQAVCQALVNLLKQKNLIGRAELDRCLADAYNAAAQDAESQGLLAIPTVHATVHRQ